MVIMPILNQMINSWVDITGNQIKRSINIDVSFYLKSSNSFRRVNPAVSGINIQLGSGSCSYGLVRTNSVCHTSKDKNVQTSFTVSRYKMKYKVRLTHEGHMT